MNRELSMLVEAISREPFRGRVAASCEREPLGRHVEMSAALGAFQQQHTARGPR